MDKELLVSSIRSIPDFPKEGILFRDVTTLFKNADAFKEAVDAIYELYKDKGITKVAGLESRGFILGAAWHINLAQASSRYASPASCHVTHTLKNT